MDEVLGSSGVKLKFSCFERRFFLQNLPHTQEFEILLRNVRYLKRALQSEIKLGLSFYDLKAILDIFVSSSKIF